MLLPRERGKVADVAAFGPPVSALLLGGLVGGLASTIGHAARERQRKKALHDLAIASTVSTPSEENFKEDFSAPAPSLPQFLGPTDGAVAARL